MNSCIYNGEVTHTRFKPVRHFLKYNTFSFLIDLDEINQLDRSINNEKVLYFKKCLTGLNLVCVTSPL